MSHARDKLMGGNENFIADKGYAVKRAATVLYDQNPYAIVVTCSDSRLAPELIFSADIGELFVVRTTDMTIGDFALGEY